MSDITNKIILLLSQFSSRDQRLFGEFLASPFHNKNKVLLKFYEAIVAERNLQKTSKAELFRKAFPGRKYDDLKFRHLCSNLQERAEAFLAHLSLQERPKTMQLLTAEQLENYKPEKIWEKFYREASGSPSGAADELLAQYYLERSKGRMISARGDRAQEPNLQQISDALDRFFYLEKLKILCDATSFEQLSKHRYQIGLSEEIKKNLAAAPSRGMELIRAYHAAWEILQQQDNEDSFRQLLQVLRTNIHHFPESDKHSLLVFAKNFCIRRVNAGKPEWFEPLFELYQLELSERIGFENGRLLPHTYKNIAAAGIYLGRLNWVKDFLETYREWLPPASAENQYSFNMAKWHFASGHYTAVKKLLQHIEYTEAFLQMDAKVLLAKTYIESGDEEAALNTAESLRQFASRQKQLGYHRQHYLAFCRYMHRLVNASGKNKGQRNSLRQAVMQENSLMEKNWFWDKLNA